MSLNINNYSNFISKMLSMVNNGSTITNNPLLTKALETLEEMFEDRKYSPIKGEDNKYITETGKFVIVSIIESISQIKNFSKYIEDPDYETVFFLYLNNVTVIHKENEKSLNYKIEIWSIENLVINVARHVLQPKVEKAKSAVKISEKLPKIQFYDPIVRYYRFKHRDVLKITDSRGFISYRVVV